MEVIQASLGTAARTGPGRPLILTLLEAAERPDTVEPDGWCDGHGEHEEFCGVADAVFWGAWGETSTLLAEMEAECHREGDAICARVMRVAQVLNLGVGTCYGAYRRWWRLGGGLCGPPRQRRDGQQAWGAYQP
ncbi:MAG: hypothetical protein KatS3mg014_1828 [Actinomycetota bacterium]|nr:MAG: hypothetical protein KatS3mg014_1828 [Actinomycetota bacterium]